MTKMTSQALTSYPSLWETPRVLRWAYDGEHPYQVLSVGRVGLLPFQGLAKSLGSPGLNAPSSRCMPAKSLAEACDLWPLVFLCCVWVYAVCVQGQVCQCVRSCCLLKFPAHLTLHSFTLLNFKSSTLTPRIFSSDSKIDKGQTIADHVGSYIFVKKRLTD